MSNPIEIDEKEQLAAVLSKFTVREIDELKFRKVVIDGSTWISVIDYIGYATGLNSDSSRKTFSNILKNNQDLKNVIKYHIFKGNIKNTTAVATVDILVRIHQLLPAKYNKDFRKKLEQLYLRYVGGDTTLAAEVITIDQAYRQLQQQPNVPETPAIVLAQAHREHVLANQPVDQLQTIMSDENYIRNRVKSADSTKQLITFIDRNFQLSASGDDPSIQVQMIISKTVLGMNPGEFLRKHKLATDSARDVMTANQIKFIDCVSSAILEELEINLTKYKSSGFNGDLIRMVIQKCQCFKQMFPNSFGKYQVPTNLRCVRETLEDIQAPAIECSTQPAIAE